MQHYTVLLDNFEGPLDLLLQLVEREKLDVRDVALSQVTKSYIEHMQAVQLSPSEVNEFITVAAQLVFTKSKRVLPSTDLPQDEQPEADIAQRLERYQQYRGHAQELGQRSASPFLLAAVKPSFRNTYAQSVALSPAKLAAVWKQLCKAQHPRTTPKHEIRLKPTTLQVVVVSLAENLSHTKQLSLSRLMELAATPREAILSFLAVLELSKQNRAIIELTQENEVLISPILGAHT